MKWLEHHLIPVLKMWRIGVTELLMSPGKLPDCSGSRNLNDNISDLRAQVAANQKVLFNQSCMWENNTHYICRDTRKSTLYGCAN